MEKPVGVHVEDINKMIKAFREAQKKKPDLIFSAMFQQRTLNCWKKVKQMITSGKLGKLIRTTWIITDWYRTQHYYDTGGWRATWKGEGGGVLLNQCPHNLDLFQWFAGVPDRITGFASLGKYHDIEVEDEVTAYFEYKNGMVAHFMTSTGESPGTNRLEIVGEFGKLIYDDGKLIFYKNKISLLKDIKRSKKSFDKVANEKRRIPFEPDKGPGHRNIIKNFADTLVKGKKLIAPAIEGLNSVMISNAIMLSSFRKKTIDIPFNPKKYTRMLKKLVKKSKFVKKTVTSGEKDMSGSF